MNKIAVTGGGGFIGLALVKALRKRKLQVRVLGRHRYSQAEQYGARCLVGDIRDQRFVRNCLEGVDTVFHVAAKAGIWGPWREYFGINVSGTANILAACLHNRVKRLVYTSTPSVVFGGLDLEGVDESVPYAARPLCHYQRTKILAEKLVLAANQDQLLTTAIRPHLVWGPGDTNLIPRLITRGRTGRLRIVGQGTNRVDISYIDNVVAAHLLLAQDLAGHGRSAGRAFFVSQGDPVALWPWINGLFHRLHMEPVNKRISLRTAWFTGLLMEAYHGLLSRQKEPLMTRFLAEQLGRSHWFSIGRIRKLGYHPEIDTTTGMNRLVAWLTAKGKIEPA